MDKHMLMLNSILVAITVGFREIAEEIADDRGLHETSLKLRLGDMNKLFQQACSVIEQMNDAVEVQED